MRLHDFLDHHARDRPESEFAVHAGRKLSYADAQAEANRIANALIGAGLEAGDRVAFLAKNCIEYVLFYFGASKAGVVPVPLNYRLAPPEWRTIVADAGARLLVARGEFAAAIDPIRGDLASVDRWVALDTPPPTGWESYAGWIDGADTGPPARRVDEDDDVYQMYTSGTTGRPKGAVLSHRGLCANLFQLLTVLSGEPGRRVLIVAPFYHAAAAVTAFSAITWGGSLYIQEEFDPAETVRALDEEEIFSATLVPAMIQACLMMDSSVTEREYRGLRRILYGASPIAERTLRRAMDVFGCEFVQAYGMTETTAVLTFLLPEDHRKALAGHPHLLLSAGRAVVGTELRIVDEQDRPVENGTIGEICARAPQLMRGYWKLPDATEATLRNGWMHTGDAGTLDDEGYLFVQDRTKDMIVSGGENVYPREVEDVIFQHPAVADVAVIGVPNEQWGEAVKAIVVLRDGAAASADEIIDFCRGRLGGYKRPRSVDFAAELPRNPSGKVLKRELREPFWKDQRRRVS
ncbi:MAG: long-chain-fatty-acid--CoA ligase [Myxococcota bacterium]